MTKRILKGKWKVVLLILILILLLVFGCVIGSAFILNRETSPVNQTLTRFLQDLSTDNLDHAYSLFSTQTKAAKSKMDLQQMIVSGKAQFSDFKSVENTYFYVDVAPWHTMTCNYSGIVTYNNGDKGTLTASLIKENGEWKIILVTIVVDVNRMNEFK